MKAVLDTNVLIAAFLSEGACKTILRRAAKRQFTAVTSLYILDEFARVMKKKFKAGSQKLGELLYYIEEACPITVSTENVVCTACEDPDDNPVLATDMASNADYLVTGDRLLLAVQNIGETRLITPREFDSLFGG